MPNRVDDLGDFVSTVMIAEAILRRTHDISSLLQVNVKTVKATLVGNIVKDVPMASSVML